MAHLDTKTGDKVYTIDYPNFNVNHLYVKSVFDIVFALIEVAKDMRDYNDLRFNTLTLMLLNFGLDEETQQKLIDEREQLVKQNTEGITDMEEKNLEIHKVNIGMAGKWLKTLNKYITFEEKLEIMRVGPDDK
jgi:hypothetical protein